MEISPPKILKAWKTCGRFRCWFLVPLTVLAFSSGANAGQDNVIRVDALTRLWRLKGISIADSKPALSKSSSAGNSAESETAIRIAGKNWSSPFFSKGPSSYVWNIQSVSDGIFATGRFSGTDDLASACISKWTANGWTTRFSGFRYGKSELLAVLPVGNSLVVGGSFNSIGSLECQNVAKWNGTAWESMGSLPYGVTALGESDGSILAASSDDGIYSWNGSVWTRMGEHMIGVVSRIENVGGKVWIAGDFTLFPSQNIRNLAVWNNGLWAPQSEKSVDPVRDLAKFGEEVFIIHNHVRDIGTDSQTVMKWDGVNWEFCDFPNTMVTKQSFAADSKDLYLVGSTANIHTYGFVSDMDMSGLLISKWTSNQFQSTAVTGIDGRVFTAAVSNGDLILGGAFSQVGATRADNLVRWNSSGFNALSNVTTPAPPFKTATLFSDGPSLYFGRPYGPWENTRGGAIFRWDGVVWDSLDGGFKNTVGPLNGAGLMVRFASVNAIAGDGAKIYAGGLFDSTARLPAKNIAQWNGSSWEPMGEGFEGIVYAILPFEGGIIIAGNPTWGNNTPKLPDPVSRWSGSKWERMPGVVEGNATGLFQYKGTLYAAGYFRFTIDGSWYTLMKWNGTAWGPEQAFAQDSVNTRSPFDDFKIVGEDLYLVNGIAGLRRWDGAHLSDRLLETKGICNMAVYGKDLFIYGPTLMADGAACIVAKWDGSRGTPIVLGENSEYAQVSKMPICVHDRALYISHESIVDVNGKNASGYARFDLEEGSSVRRPPITGGTHRAVRHSGILFDFGANRVRADGRSTEMFEGK